MEGFSKMETKVVLDINLFSDVVDFVEHYSLDVEYMELFNGRADDYVHEQLGYSTKDVIENLRIRLEERENCYSKLTVKKEPWGETYEIELYDYAKGEDSEEGMSDM